MSKFATRIARDFRCSLPTNGDFSQATLQLPYRNTWPVGVKKPEELALGISPYGELVRP